jgi:putative oxidoreductase
MKPLTDTNTKTIAIGILLLRIMCGLILFVAGAGKVLGWFEGMGMNATIQAFKSGSHISTFWIYVSCYAEFIGGFLIIIGWLTRPAAFALFINMLVATLVVGFKNFFGGGAAYPCLLMVCFLVILLTGPMNFSIDSLIGPMKKGERNNLKYSTVL